MNKRPNCDGCKDIPEKIDITLYTTDYRPPNATNDEKKYELLQKQMAVLKQVELKYVYVQINMPNYAKGYRKDYDLLYVCPSCGSYFGYKSEYNEDGPGNLSSERWITLNRLPKKGVEELLASNEKGRREKEQKEKKLQKRGK